MSSQTTPTNTKPVQVQARWGPSPKRGKWTWDPTTTQEDILRVKPTNKGKISFCQWTLPGYINHTTGQAACTQVVGQHKTN